MKPLVLMTIIINSLFDAAAVGSGDLAETFVGASGMSLE